MDIYAISSISFASEPDIIIFCLERLEKKGGLYYWVQDTTQENIGTDSPRFYFLRRNLGKSFEKSPILMRESDLRFKITLKELVEKHSGNEKHITFRIEKLLC